MDRRHFLTTAFWLATGSAVPLRMDGSGGFRSEFRPLRRNVGLYTGRGGTIGWLADPEAIVVIDAQFPPSAEQFHQRVQQLSALPIDTLINTHHHSDHTAGNLYLRERVGRIVSHNRVPELQQIMAERRGTATEQVYADTTFETEWSIDTGTEVIRAGHYGPAHTSGDIVVRFERANIVHLGDLVFNRWFPFIDLESGASIRNWISVLETVASESEPDTIFIFGHGNTEFGVTGRRQDLLVMRDYLTTLLEYVERIRSGGHSLQELLNLPGPAGFDDFVSPGARLSLRSNLQAAWQELNGSSQ